MKPRTIFSKKDILVVFACVVFLLINLGAIGSTGRRRAKEMVCLSNLRQWGAIWHTFTNDNNGYFCEATSSFGHGWLSGRWILAIRPYMETRTNLLRCPEAIERLVLSSGYSPYYGGPFNTYIMGSTVGTTIREEGSYGANLWIYNPGPIDIAMGHIQNRPVEWHWKTPHVKGANNIPVFADIMWRGGGPFDGSAGTDQLPERGMPPDYDGQWAGSSPAMYHFCINRHNGAVNHLFMDWSVRKVGLKELWKLKWHRNFNTDGPWTTAGGATQRDWPDWMRDFKPY